MLNMLNIELALENPLIAIRLGLGVVRETMNGLQSLKTGFYT
jgi:hypothetical protein